MLIVIVDWMGYGGNAYFAQSYLIPPPKRKKYKAVNHLPKKCDEGKKSSTNVIAEDFDTPA